MGITLPSEIPTQFLCLFCKNSQFFNHTHREVQHLRLLTHGFLNDTLKTLYWHEDLWIICLSEWAMTQRERDKVYKSEYPYVISRGMIE